MSEDCGFPSFSASPQIQRKEKRREKKYAFSCACVGIITFMVRCSYDLCQTPVGVAV